MTDGASCGSSVCVYVRHAVDVENSEMRYVLCI